MAYRINKLLAFGLILLAFFMLISCEAENQVKEENPIGTLSIDISNAIDDCKLSNTRGVDSSTTIAIKEYRITGSGPNGNTLGEKRIQATSNSTISYKSLAVGNWNIKVEAINPDEVIIGEGNTNITIENGKNSNVTIPVYELEGDGILLVNVNYSNNNDESIKLIVKNGEGEVVSESTLIRTGDDYGATITLPKGFYQLYFNVNNGDEKFLETVRIVKGATTAFKSKYEKEINSAVDIETFIVFTPQIELTTKSNEIAQNGTLEATATVTGIENASYSWYIDGTLLNEETGTSLSYSLLSNLAHGKHRLTFVVSNGEVIWSKDSYFTVIDAIEFENFTINQTTTEYLYSEKLNVSLSMPFDDTYSIKWYIGSKEIIPSEVYLGDYIGNQTLRAVVEKDGVSSYATTSINIKAVASNLKIDSAYAGLFIKGRVDIEPKRSTNYNVELKLQSVNDNSSFTTYVYINDNGEFSNEIPDNLEAGVYNVSINDSQFSSTENLQINVSEKPTFSIKGNEKIKQYSEAVFEISPNLDLPNLSWHIDDNYYGNSSNEKNKFVIEYDRYSPSSYPSVGEHTLKAYFNNKELASFNFTIEDLDELNSTIINALPGRYYYGNEIYSKGISSSILKFKNATAALDDGSKYTANTYNNDSIEYIFSTENKKYTVEIKGECNINYEGNDYHYSIGSLSFNYVSFSENNLTITNVTGEKVFKGNEDISNNSSELNKLANFATNLMGTEDGITFENEKYSGEQEYSFTDYGYNGYKVKGSVNTKNNLIDQETNGHTVTPSLTFTIGDISHKFSYIISYKTQNTNNGTRWFNTVISDIKFDDETVDSSKLTDLAITRIKDFAGDQEW